MSTRSAKNSTKTSKIIKAASKHTFRENRNVLGRIMEMVKEEIKCGPKTSADCVYRTSCPGKCVIQSLQGIDRITATLNLKLKAAWIAV